MRIIGGQFRGTRLAAPGAQGGGRAHLRPTSDRVREALFNLLAHGDYPEIEGARVLDLFAGTGALGLEALSRGAERAVFIDDGAAARGLIRENIDKLGVIGRTKLWRRDATRLGPCRGAAYSIWSSPTRPMAAISGPGRSPRPAPVAGSRRARRWSWSRPRATRSPTTRTWSRSTPAPMARPVS